LEHVTRPNAIRLSVFLLVFSASLTALRADVMESTNTLPPPNGVFTLPTVCTSAGCVVGGQVSDFTNIMGSIPPTGDQMVTTDAVFTGMVYTDNMGMPGTFLGNLDLDGFVDFTFFGRNQATPVNTPTDPFFASQITDFMFSGTFQGPQMSAPFVIEQNPTMSSLGQTSIVELSRGMFDVSSFFDVFAQVSIDNGPFVAGPSRMTTLNPIPEPGSGVLAAAILAGLLAVARRRRRQNQ
jgi:hypothetical protein